MMRVISVCLYVRREQRLGVEMLSSILCWHREQQQRVVMQYSHLTTRCHSRNVPPLHFIRGSQVMPAFCLFVFSVEWLLSIQISVVCTKISNPWRTSTKTSATSTWPFVTWRSAFKWGKVPIRSGKCATAGLNRIPEVRNDRSRFRNVKKHEEPVTFLKGSLKISEC